MFDGVGTVAYIAVWVFILWFCRQVMTFEKHLPLDTPERKLGFPVIFAGILPFALVGASGNPWIALISLIVYALVFWIGTGIAIEYFKAHPLDRPATTPALIPAPPPQPDFCPVVIEYLERVERNQGRILSDDLKTNFTSIMRTIELEDFTYRLSVIQSWTPAHVAEHYTTSFKSSFEAYLKRIPQDAPAVFSARFTSVIPVGQLVIDMMHTTGWNEQYGCFHTLHETLQTNYWAVTNRFITKKEEIAAKLRIYPNTYPGDPSEIPTSYLRNTPFLDLFKRRSVPFNLDPQQRLEHMFIHAPSGTGKTQLMQAMIAYDLDKVRVGDASVILIDSQGVNRRETSRPTIIENLINLQVFATDLKDKLTYVKPSADLAFNIFDMGQNNPKLTEEQRMLRRTTARNIILTSIAAGSALQYQMLLRCVELAMLADNPTIRTLRRILTTDQKGFGTAFAGLLRRADEDIRDYFRSAFFSGSASVKDALIARLEGLSAEPLFRTMLSKPTNDFHMIDEIEAGKVIVVDADKTLLGERGAEAFGRFFLAQLLFASRQRQSTKPVYVYIDECHDFVSDDENITSLLHQARKQDIGVILGTSGLHLINSAKVKQSLAGVAIVVDHEQGKPRGTFNLCLRDRKDPIEVKVKPSVMENMPRMTDEQFAEVHKPKAKTILQLVPQPPREAGNDDDVV